MGNYYFDIETTGLDPKKSKVITIQYQELDRKTGEAIGKLVILKEWESSEREIIEKFLKESGITNGYQFNFVPIGYNLNFERDFLKEKTGANGFPPLDIVNKPFIDLRAFGIIMNNGEFKGSGLDRITAKPMDGSQVPVWYENREYHKIIKYIEDETKAFIQLNTWLYREMPKFLERFKKESIG